jgi:MFS family permease
MNHLCSILNGLSGALMLVVIPAFSARWFPNHERTTATSIVASLNNLGIAASFIFPNLLVPADNDPILQRWYIQRFMLFGLHLFSPSPFFPHEDVPVGQSSNQIALGSSAP